MEGFEEGIYLSFVLYMAGLAVYTFDMIHIADITLTFHLSGRAAMLFPTLLVRLSRATTAFRTQAILNEIVEDACISSRVRILKIQTMTGAGDCDSR